MSDFVKFRSSWGGFHRGDVTNYMEKLCAEHQRTTHALREENDRLAQQVSVLEPEVTRQSEQLRDLTQQLEQSQTALASTQAALEEALELVANEEPEEAPDYVAMELEAYRRAEATERMAAERAQSIRARLDDLLEQVSGRYSETGLEIQSLSADLRNNLQRLEDALSDLNVIFDETTDGFDQVNETEE